MRRIAWTTLAAALLLATGAAAQDAQSFVFGQYTRCNVGQEARADVIVRTVLGPIMQKHVDAGQLESWDYLAHVQGGPWRRLSVLRGTDLNVMLDASAQIVQEFQAEHGDAASELGSICPSHDDYIWTGVAMSPPNPDPSAGPASLSTYYVCDVAKEARADEIFEELLAPLYKKHTDMGHLAGWAYLAHRNGGPFRRLETFSGPDHKTLFGMQNAIYQEAQETNPLAFNEFRQICGSHSDYLWMNARQ